MRLDAITTRYARLFNRVASGRRTPKLARRQQNRQLMLWHIHIEPDANDTVRPLPVYRYLRRRRLLPCMPTVAQQGLHIRMFYSFEGDYTLLINSTPFVTTFPVQKVLEDTVPHFLDPRRKWTVVSAALTGNVHQLCASTQRWKKQIRSDNKFLRSMAQGWLLNKSFTEHIEEIVVHGKEHLPIFITNTVKRYAKVALEINSRFRDNMHRRIARHLSDNAPEIYEFTVLNEHITIKSGYDDFEGSLLDKLRAALSNRNCIQDVGGELCEMLSVPYPPEDCNIYAKFQCDHTNIPPPITVNVRSTDLDTISEEDEESLVFERSLGFPIPALFESPSPFDFESEYNTGAEIDINLRLDSPEVQGPFTLNS